jgi:putative salt-induced outer membrane protein
MPPHRIVLLIVPLFLFSTTTNAAAWRATDRATGMLSEARRGKEDDKKFFGSLAAGYVGNRGNTDNTSVHAKGTFGYVTGQWRHAIMLRTLYGSTDDETTAEEYEFAEQSDYTFVGTKNYIFGALNYHATYFGSYRRRVSEVIGYGRRFVDTPEHVLDMQIGVGARQTDPGPGEDIEETIGRFDGSYVWRISDDSSFQQTLAVERGPENTYSESISEVKTNLRSNLALSVSYTARHNSTVPVDTVNTDTTTLVSLIYGF